MNNLAILYDKEGKKKEAKKFYQQAIEKGNINALYNQALYYYDNNQQKKEALQLLNKYKNLSNTPNTLIVELIFEIWNAFFQNIEERMLQIITACNYDNLSWLFSNLLIQEQTQIVSNIFEHETHGKILRDRYALLHYVTLLLLNKHSIENIELRIPPEVMPTVLKIKEEIEQRREIYTK